LLGAEPAFPFAPFDCGVTLSRHLLVASTSV
jgi:hypothetical protein